MSRKGQRLKNSFFKQILIDNQTKVGQQNTNRWLHVWTFVAEQFGWHGQRRSFGQEFFVARERARFEMFFYFCRSQLAVRSQQKSTKLDFISVRLENCRSGRMFGWRFMHRRLCDEGLNGVVGFVWRRLLSWHRYGYEIFERSGKREGRHLHGRSRSGRTGSAGG